MHSVNLKCGVSLLHETFKYIDEWKKPPFLGLDVRSAAFWIAIKPKESEYIWCEKIGMRI